MMKWGRVGAGEMGGMKMGRKGVEEMEEGEVGGVRGGGVGVVEVDGGL